MCFFRGSSSCSIADYTNTLVDFILRVANKQCIRFIMVQFSAEILTVSEGKSVLSLAEVQICLSRFAVHLNQILCFLHHSMQRVIASTDSQ